MKQPFYVYLGFIGLVIFIVYHMIYGWSHTEENPYHWLHELSSALLVLMGLSYWIEEIIKTAISKSKHE